MAAHTYLRIGRYQDAAAVNAFALQVDSEHFTATATPGPVAGASYYGHNLRFGMAGTLLSGDGVLALKFADHLHRAYPERSFVRDGMIAAETQRFVIYARYAPGQMLSLPEPAADNVLTRSQYRYARGEAFATLRDAAGLAREAALVTGDNPHIRVARGVLAGRLAMLEGRYGEAARAFDDAASLQEKDLTGMDPPDWWYPVRRSEAAAWLQAGQFARAAEAAGASLAKFPRDPLALLVLSRAEEGLGRTADARRHRQQAIGAWEGDLSKVDIGTI
jgi:tetratricopeptide (TPR) repeat protein